MSKKAFFFIDDTIWVFRDLATKKPASMFDLPFLKMLKDIHELYGVKTQLNVFYQTDPSYGDEHFDLSQTPDTYKAEWEANSDWLKLGFHAKQEFPDFPWANASYDETKQVFDNILSEVLRFAGPASFSYGAITHWVTLSKGATKALADSGIKIVNATRGTRSVYQGNEKFPVDAHADLLTKNRLPETDLMVNKSLDGTTYNFICSYNHLSEEVCNPITYKLTSIPDKEINIKFRCMGHLTMNNYPLEILAENIDAISNDEYVGVLIHEQYFYEHYWQYQPDYDKKLHTMGKLLSEKGYTFVCGEDLA